MIRKCAKIALFGLVAMATQSVQADEQWFGYRAIDVPPNTDIHFTVPFDPEIEGTYTVASASGTTITPTVALNTGEYSGSAYYIRFVDGAAEGLWVTIASNDAASFAVANADVVAHAAPGDEFRVYKHHTLSSIFPPAMEGTSFNNQCQVLIYDNNLSTITQNRSAAKTAFRIGANWLGSGVNNNTILPPETQCVLRNNSSEQLQFVTYGNVPDYSVSVLVAPNGDVNIGTGYPVPVSLKDAGLSGASRQVLFYDNEATGINKSASKTAFSLGPNWVGAGVTGNEPLGAGESFTLRLPSSETATKVTIKKPY